MIALALSLIAELREAGAVLTCSTDGRVRFSAPLPLPRDLLARARLHRNAIAEAMLAEDTAATDTTPDPPPLPEPGSAARARWDAEQARMVRGLLETARQRPPFWTDSTAIPSPGCWCSCCHGSRWWTEIARPTGWCCGVCHPPRHLRADAVRWVATAGCEGD